MISVIGRGRAIGENRCKSVEMQKGRDRLASKQYIRQEELWCNGYSADVTSETTAVQGSLKVSLLGGVLMRSNKDDDGGQSKAMAERWMKERKEGKEGRIATKLAGWPNVA